MLHSVVVYIRLPFSATHPVLKSCQGEETPTAKAKLYKKTLKEEYGSLGGATFKIKCHLFFPNHNSV